MTRNERFIATMQDRASLIRQCRSGNAATKAWDTMRTREALLWSGTPSQIQQAIFRNFCIEDIERLNPAEKAHFTRGTYDQYLVATSL